MAKLLLVHPAGIFEEAETKINPSYPPMGMAFMNNGSICFTQNRLLHSYRVLYKLRSFEDLKLLMGIARRAMHTIFSPLNQSKSTSGILRG